MAIGTDIEIQNDKDVRYTGAAHGASGAGYYTVLEFHRWAQERAAELGFSGDDFMDITKDTPTDKSFDTIINVTNGFNIDDTLAEHLYGGSIIQSDGDEIYDGMQVVAPSGTFMEILQNGALVANDFWNNTPFGAGVLGLNADIANGISHQFMLKVRTGGADIDGRRFVALTREWGKNYGERKINGTGRGVNVVALPGGDTDLNNATASGTVAGWTGITNTSAGYNGIDVNNDAADEYYYSEWNKDTYSINQFYERMKYLTRRGETTTLYGLQGQIFRGITHEITVDTPSATDFSAVEAVSWPTGTGQMLAINDVNAPTKMWIQLLTGTAPVDNQTITGGTSGATCLVNVTVTERTVSAPFCGVSTGSSIIGAYGFGLEALDLSANDKVFDLTNTLYQAPNYVTFTVGGMVSGEDAVLVGPRGYRFNYDSEASGPFVAGETLTFTSPAGTAKVASVRDLGTTGEIVIGPILTGSAPADNSGITGGTSGATASVNGTVKDSIDTGQFTLNGALSGGAVTSVVVNEAIPADTPAAGSIRILRANGAYSRHAYSAYNSGTKTFTITSHDFSSNGAADDANAYVSYLDKLSAAASEAFTTVYLADRSLFIRVRDGGASPIKTFETLGTLGAGGGSVTAGRTSDA